MRRFLLIPHLRIHNANAISSPFTIGFPAMTAWMGAVHALQRYLQQEGWNEVIFKKLAISCHDFDLQTYKGKGDFVHSIIGTSNPLGEKGNRPAFIEEGRCHFDVSLLIEYQGVENNNKDTEEFENLINRHVHRMKWASGDLLTVKPVKRLCVDEDIEVEVKNILRELMIGYVLIERRDLMIKAMSEGDDAMNALLNHLKVMHRSTQDEDGEITWTSRRKEPGWLVPIATGFQGISPLAKAQNQRDMSIDHRFAESVITLGEFVMPLPHRIRDLDDILWRYHVDAEKNLYLCQNQTLK